MPYEAVWYNPPKLNVSENNVPISLERGATAKCGDCGEEFSIGHKETEEFDAAEVMYCPYCGKYFGGCVMGDERW